MTLPKPLHVFKLYPNPHGRLHFLVKVFKNKTAMRKYGKYSGLVSPPFDYGAICIGYSSWLVPAKNENKPLRLTPIIGELHFHRGQLGSETISHECAHALFRWMRRKRLQVPHGDPNHGPSPKFTTVNNDPQR